MSPRGRAPLAPYLTLVASVLVVVAVFLPWYATNIGPPFAPGTVSGFEATGLAKAALAAAAVAVLAAGALAADGRRATDLGPRAAEALAWVAIVAATAAAVLVGYRLLVLPEPAEFLSRRAGLYLAMAGAVGAVVAGLAQLRTLDRPR